MNAFVVVVVTRAFSLGNMKAKVNERLISKNTVLGHLTVHSEYCHFPLNQNPYVRF